MNRFTLVLGTLAIISISATSAHAKPRKLSTAYAFSGVGTGVSAALIATSFALPSNDFTVNGPLLYTGIATSVLTPSLGNWYAGHWLTAGMGIRLAGGLLGAWGVSHYTQEHRCNTTEVAFCKEISNTGISLLAVGGLVFVGGAAWDFKSIQSDVDDYNTKHAFNWNVTPTPPGTGQGAMLGVGGVW